MHAMIAAPIARMIVAIAAVIAGLAIGLPVAPG